MKFITLLIFFASFYISPAFSYMHETSSSQQTDNQAIQKTIFESVNAYRTEHGLNALKLDSFISEVARKHSLNMAEHKTPFGHNEFNNRMKTIFSHYGQTYSMAENVAFTEFEPTTVTQMWLHSRGHRKNIEGNYNLTGIGYVRDKFGRSYVTQIFANSKQSE